MNNTFCLQTREREGSGRAEKDLKFCINALYMMTSKET